MPPKTRSATKKEAKSASPVKTGYLILYNALSAAAWSLVLAGTVTTAADEGPQAVFPVIGEYTKWVQTAAILEVMHSLLGVVRAPLFTTVMQVASRLLLVWGIVYPFPEVAYKTPYTSMLVAWSITEVIRYSFFAFSLSGWQPKALTWLRYNTFFVLYPLGISSECTLVWLASKIAAGIDDMYKYPFWAVLAIYVPGAYILYTYMMKQRNKVMKA